MRIRDGMAYMKCPKCGRESPSPEGQFSYCWACKWCKHAVVDAGRCVMCGANMLAEFAGEWEVRTPTGVLFAAGTYEQCCEAMRKSLPCGVEAAISDFKWTLEKTRPEDKDA